MNGQIDDLIKLPHPHLIRIYQDGQLLHPQLPGVDEVSIDLIPAGFHCSKIKTSRKGGGGKAEAKAEAEELGLKQAGASPASTTLLEFEKRKFYVLAGLL